MSDPVSELTSRITAVGWTAYVVGGVLAIIGLANLTDALRKIHKLLSRHLCAPEGSKDF